MSSIVRGEGLWRIYKMDAVEVEALRGISIDVQRAEFIAITGPSGCGKSTLLNLLGCLDRPTRGKVFFDEEDVSRLGDAALTRIRAQRVGFIFQTYNLMPTLNVRDNVELQLNLAGVSGAKASRTAAEALERVGLAERMKHLPRQLSGGERQRVAIARAIAKGPDLLMADEPTGNLDSAQGRQVMETLWELNRQGQTVIAVTHNVELASMSKRIIRMRDGLLLGEGVRGDAS